MACPTVVKSCMMQHWGNISITRDA
jgi:hypothetical protein